VLVVEQLQNVDFPFDFPGHVTLVDLSAAEDLDGHSLLSEFVLCH